MKVSPILFSDYMMRALIEGRKTQTRRRINAPTTRGENVISLNDGIPELQFGPEDRKPNGDLRWHRCPYGQPGDLLWVRETMLAWIETLSGQFSHVAAFKADGYELEGEGSMRERWTSAIHMPRKASRLTLRLTDVRVQRLQEISEQDVAAEGIVPLHRAGKLCGWGLPPHNLLGSSYPAQAYGVLWDSINGVGSCASNPWVWALTFEVIKANIDEVLKGAA